MVSISHQEIPTFRIRIRLFHIVAGSLLLLVGLSFLQISLLRSPPGFESSSRQAKEYSPFFQHLHRVRGYPLHFVVSSDCSPYQRWQVLTQIHSARSVDQVGRYTWIASGCATAEEAGGSDVVGEGKDARLVADAVRRDVDGHFSAAAEDGGGEGGGGWRRLTGDEYVSRPFVHFTPDFSDMSAYGGPYADGTKERVFVNRMGKIQHGSYGNRYKFNNKPNGLLHWAEQRYGTSVSASVIDEVVVLIDPDFLFLYPFEIKVTVEPGHPAAAKYGLGAQWLHFNRTAICGKDSPCIRTTSKEVEDYYSAGPPYLIHGRDVLRLSRKWAEFVSPTYDQYPLLYAEMYAYSAAAAHLELPHNLTKGLFTGCMVGWPEPTDKEQRRALSDSFHAYRREVTSGRITEHHGGASSCFMLPFTPPPFLHLCQRYVMQTNMAPDDGKRNDLQLTLGGRRYFYAKRRVNHGIMGCAHGAFEPFIDLEGKEKLQKPGSVAEEWSALAICAASRAINFAKDCFCQKAAEAKT